MAENFVLLHQGTQSWNLQIAESQQCLQLDEIHRNFTTKFAGLIIFPFTLSTTCISNFKTGNFLDTHTVIIVRTF